MFVDLKVGGLRLDLSLRLFAESRAELQDFFDCIIGGETADLPGGPLRFWRKRVNGWRTLAVLVGGVAVGIIVEELAWRPRWVASRRPEPEVFPAEPYVQDEERISELAG